MRVWTHLDHYFWVKLPKILRNNIFLHKKCVLAVFDGWKHGGIGKTNVVALMRKIVVSMATGSRKIRKFLEFGFHGN